MNVDYQIAFVILAYLMGSLPVGYWLTRYATGKNILEWGSGNVGSTNVQRIAGKKIALVTQLLDMLKGLIPVLLFQQYFASADSPCFIYIIALAAIAGHDFSLFLKFRGGKGVNTTLGASVLLAPVAVFVSVALYFIVKWRFTYVSLGSLVLSVSLPVTEGIVHGFTPVFYYLLACMLLIVIRHHQNIRRMLLHQELSSN